MGGLSGSYNRMSSLSGGDILQTGRFVSRMHFEIISKLRTSLTIDQATNLILIYEALLEVYF
jgi:hypothetical protein